MPLSTTITGLKIEKLTIKTEADATEITTAAQR